LDDAVIGSLVGHTGILRQWKQQPTTPVIVDGFTATMGSYGVHDAPP
jgi:hypothetical protein